LLLTVKWILWMKLTVNPIIATIGVTIGITISWDWHQVNWRS
jgi:hypothetical protein